MKCLLPLLLSIILLTSCSSPTPSTTNKPPESVSPSTAGVLSSDPDETPYLSDAPDATAPNASSSPSDTSSTVESELSEAASQIHGLLQGMFNGLYDADFVYDEAGEVIEALPVYSNKINSSAKDNLESLKLDILLYSVSLDLYGYSIDGIEGLDDLASAYFSLESSIRETEELFDLPEMNIPELIDIIEPSSSPESSYIPSATAPPISGNWDDNEIEYTHSSFKLHEIFDEVRLDFLVEVENTSGHNLELKDIAIDIYDSDNNFTGTCTKFVQGFPSIIRPGEKGYFATDDATLQGLIDINQSSSYTYKYKAIYSRTSESPESFTVSDVLINSSKEGELGVIGHVYNDSDKEGFRVFIVFYDKNNVPLRHFGQYFSYCTPHANNTFEITRDLDFDFSEFDHYAIFAYS